MCLVVFLPHRSMYSNERMFPFFKYKKIYINIKLYIKNKRHIIPYINKHFPVLYKA